MNELKKNNSLRTVRKFKIFSMVLSVPAHNHINTEESSEDFYPC